MKVAPHASQAAIVQSMPYFGTDGLDDEGYRFNVLPAQPQNMLRFIFPSVWEGTGEYGWRKEMNIFWILLPYVKRFAMFLHQIYRFLSSRIVQMGVSLILVKKDCFLYVFFFANIVETHSQMLRSEKQFQ